MRYSSGWSTGFNTNQPFRAEAANEVEMGGAGSADPAMAFDHLCVGGRTAFASAYR